MKMILLFTGIIGLLTTTGCLHSNAEWHGHAGGQELHGHRTDVRAEPYVAPKGVERPPDYIAP